MTGRHDLLVIGAGVVGLSAARELAARGARVLVVDADPDGGAGSRAAAGVAIPSLRLLADPVMAEFVAQARLRLDADVAALEPTAPGLRRGQGVLRPVRDQRERDALHRLAAADPEALGRWLDGSELAEVEPVLGAGPFTGGFLAERASVVDTVLYVDGLAGAARSCGVEVRLGERVVGIDEEPDGVSVRTVTGTVTAERLLVAAGAWSGVLPGLPALPIRPVRGQMVEVRHPLLRPGRIVSGRTYLCPWRAGTACLGATEEDAGFAAHPTAAGTAYLLSRLVRDFPLLAEARPERIWAGLRSAAPDGRLVAGRYPGTRRVFVGTGHGGQGILTGACSGLALAAELDTGRSSLPEEFRADRALSASGTGGA